MMNFQTLDGKNEILMAAPRFEHPKLLQIDSAAFSHRGQKRDLNQDAVFHQTNLSESGYLTGLYIVCDGMGGRQIGEIASRMAVDSISIGLGRLFSLSSLDSSSQTPPSRQTMTDMVETAIQKANTEIQRYAQDNLDADAKMGTTVSLVLVQGRSAKIANVGDGRIYAWRNGTLSQISQDHSLAAALAAEGLIDQADISNHPHSNVILRALGSAAEVTVDMFDWDLRAGDKLLLCSDGLWKAFGSADNLAHWLGSDRTPADLCQQMITEASDCDGSDNISAVVIAVKEAAGC